MIPQDLSFDWPFASYFLFVVIPIFVLFLYLSHYRQEKISSFLSQTNRDSLLVPRSTLNFWGKTISLCLIWILASVSLMQPKGGERYPDELKEFSEEEILLSKEKTEMRVRRRQPHEVIFLIDTSASMAVPDSRNHQSRLDYAKEIIDQISSQLTGETVSLYAFTSQVTRLVPATSDYLFLRLMVRQLSINEGEISGTDILEALNTIHQKYLKKPVSTLKTLIILTDGEDNGLQILQGSERQKLKESILNTLKNAQAFHLRVFTIGLGTKKGGVIPNLLYEGKTVVSALNEEILQELSRKGDGRYYLANDFSGIELASHLVKMMQRENPFAEEKRGHELQKRLDEEQGNVPLVYDLYFQFALGIAILLLGLVMFLPDSYMLKSTISSRKKFLVFLAIGFLQSSEMIGQEEVLKKANLYFETQEYAQAQEEYEKLLQENLTSWEKAIVFYNLGSLYLAEGLLEQAIDTFEQIKLDPQSPPFLERNLKANLSLALLKQVNQLSDKIDKSSNPEDLYQKILFLLRKTLKEIEAAKQAHCQFLQIEGRKSCSVPEDLNKIDRYAKIRLSQFLEQFQSLESSWKERSMNGILHFLSIVFLDTLEQSPLSENAIQKLVILFNQIDDQTFLAEKTQKNAEMKEKIDHIFPFVKQYLTESVAALKQGKQDAGHLFLQEAAQEIKRLEAQITPLQENKPNLALEKALDEQRHARDLSSLQIRNFSIKEIQELEKMIQNAQNLAIQMSHVFLKDALQLQKQTFKNDRLCQFKPWDEVFPLFEKGYQAAQFAEKLLEKKMLSSHLTVEKQNEAMTSWKKVLEKLKQPFFASTCKGSGRDQEQQPNQEVLNLLQQMEMEDQSPQKPFFIQEKGLRPW